METFTIKTNGVPRDVIEGYELSESGRSEFDYLDWQAIDEGSASASFFRYKGEVYDLGEFLAVREGFTPHLDGWDDYMTDSFFSGVAVKYVENGERVIVATFYC